MFLFLLVILVVSIASKLTVAEDVIVELPDGTILGRTDKSYSGTLYYNFQKIPYAAPPVGELRFQPPVPPAKWEGTLNTTYLDKICYQATTNLPEESEDCLYINVYTPALPNEDNDVALPVFVSIYGGGFNRGHAMTYKQGPEYLIDYNIIIVTFNYRVGPLGFMSTEDTVIPGNIGLKDQQLAMKWVQKNIQYFGGDPTRVTIDGVSAGSISVNFHLLNKNSDGLFRAAMMESGSAVMAFALQKNAREVAFKFASLLNDTFVNNTDDSEALLQYLQTVPVEDLDKISDLSQWSTVIEVENDNAFITEKMYSLIRDGNFVQVPVFIGLNSEEMLFWTASDLDVLKAQLEIYDSNLETLVPDEVAALLNDDTDKTFGQAIRQIYCGNGTFTENLAEGVRFRSDDFFNRAIIRTAEMKSQYVDVYFYQFSYDGPLGNGNVSLEGADKVSHGENAHYIWRITNDGYDNSDLSKYPEADVLTHRRMLKLWTNFVKTLNPTPEPDVLLENVTWPVATSGNIGDFLYLNIGENLEIKNHPKENTYRRWIELYAMLGYDDFATF